MIQYHRHTISKAMSKIIEIRLPKFPECWETCGNCASGDVTVDDVLVLPGDSVERDDTLIILETGKVALDIPSPHAGRVVALFVAAGERVSEQQLILNLEVDTD
jgi:pyruvate/2-oxoglutarate dehydrogenase complex dihydrolipoamide acyltransferase (E2) component